MCPLRRRLLPWEHLVWMGLQFSCDCKTNAWSADSDKVRAGAVRAVRIEIIDFVEQYSTTDLMSSSLEVFSVIDAVCEDCKDTLRHYRRCMLVSDCLEKSYVRLNSSQVFWICFGTPVTQSKYVHILMLEWSIIIYMSNLCFDDIRFAGMLLLLRSGRCKTIVCKKLTNRYWIRLKYWHFEFFSFNNLTRIYLMPLQRPLQILPTLR